MGKSMDDVSCGLKARVLRGAPDPSGTSLEMYCSIQWGKEWWVGRSAACPFYSTSFPLPV